MDKLKIKYNEEKKNGTGIIRKPSILTRMARWLRILGTPTSLSKTKGSASKEENGRLNGQEYGEKRDNLDYSGREIVRREEMGIFVIVETEMGCVIALGNNVLTENITYKEAKKRIEEREWKLMFNVIATTANAIIMTEKNKTD